MAISRKRALERMEALWNVAEEHVAKIAASSGHSSRRHWQHEVRNWLTQMEALLSHVGKKTAAEWQIRIDNLRGRLEEHEQPGT